ncbi:hypothetical protein IEQ34_024157 [Dendrobium chrysotoxum]|nr:hypothetical protein IEQ34_025403 [Dendrobium chrysotoxum]KAH0447018.1 hypothetical protein IEQ34_024157 [Dendrobium chrysotoxum]
MGNLSFQCYRPNKRKILVIGPVPGQKSSEIVFPILSPDPATKKDVGTEEGVRFLLMVARVTIQFRMLHQLLREGRQVVDILPPGPELLVSEGESIKLDQPLTSNPNVVKRAIWSGRRRKSASRSITSPRPSVLLGICDFESFWF